MSDRTPYTKTWQAAGLLLPTLAVIVAFLYYPSIQTFRLSLFKSGILGNHLTFVGIGNFTYLFTSSAYLNSIAVTFVFAVVVVVGSLGLSLLVGGLLYEVTNGTAAYLVATIWPYALPPAVAGTVLLFLFHPSLGVLTYVIESATGVQLDWFTNGSLALVVVALAAIWKQLGYNVIFVLAALNNVPETLNEVSELDGVGRLTRLTRVYVPLIAPTLVFLVVMDTIYAFFGTFSLVDLMTSGGPNGATNLLIFKLYRDAFRFSNLGLASAESVVLFVVVGVLTYVQLRVSDEYVGYGG